MSETLCIIDLPEYLGTVSAMRIAGIKTDVHGAGLLIPANSSYAPQPVSRAFMDTYNPQVGGYFVIGKCGHKSFAVAEAFEAAFLRFG